MLLSTRAFLVPKIFLAMVLSKGSFRPAPGAGSDKLRVLCFPCKPWIYGQGGEWVFGMESTEEEEGTEEGGIRIVAPILRECQKDILL
jgi:hypothetical protein